MGFFNKLLGKSSTATVTSEAAEKTCPHTTLTPRWDSVADMGNEEKVTSYTCQGCNQHFSPEEGRTLRRTEAERVQSELEVRT